MKLKIEKVYDKETGKFICYNLYRKALLPFCWKLLRQYNSNAENVMEHDIKWLFELNNQIINKDKFV